MLLIVAVLGASAQTAYTKRWLQPENMPQDPVEGRIYMFETALRGALKVDAAGKYLKMTTGKVPYPNNTTDLAEAQKYFFAFIQAGNGNYYLYSVARDMFVSGAEGNTALLAEKQVATALENYTWARSAGFDKNGAKMLLKRNGQNKLNINNSGNAVYGWDTEDDGNKFGVFQITTNSEGTDFQSLPADKIQELKNVLNGTAQTVNVTYQVTFNGTVVSTKTAPAYVGSTVTMPVEFNKDFVTFTAPQDLTVDAEGDVFTWTAMLNTPFEVSTDYANAHWYNFNMRDDANKYVYYVPGNSKQLYSQRKLLDEYCWAFMGNPWDGFVMINKKAGADLALTYTGNTAASAGDNPANGIFPTMQAISNATRWDVVKPNTSGFEMKVKGSPNFYINDRDGLAFWNNPNAHNEGAKGSLLQLKDLVYEETFFDNVTGTHFGDLKTNADFEAAVQAYKANPNANTYAAAEAAIPDGNNPANVVGSDGWVNLNFTVTFGQYTALENSVGVKNDGVSMQTQAKDLNNFNQLWMVEPVSKGKVKLKHSSGKYVGPLVGGGTNTIILQDTPVTYDVIWNNDANESYSFGSGIPTNTTSYLRGEGPNGNINKWDQANSYLKAIPVSTLQVPMHAATDGKSYATLYLPFGVEVSEGTDAYTATLDESGTFLKLISMDREVPATTPVVLVNETGATTATLTITDLAHQYVANVLSGTLKPMTWNANYYSLGELNGKVGFYKWDGTELAAGKAYYAPESTPAQGFAFFDGTVTGLEKLVIESAADKAVRYNLAGQRVDKNYKGVVIVNGKKMLQ